MGLDQREKPKTIGMEVLSKERRRRKVNVSFAIKKGMLKKVEKKISDNTSADTTTPVADPTQNLRKINESTDYIHTKRTDRAGKDFAVEFTVLAKPPPPHHV